VYVLLDTYNLTP